VLDEAVRESEARSWIYVGLGVGLIYGTIPLARALREVIDAQIGRQIFIYLVFALLLIVVGLALRSLYRRKLSPAAYAWSALTFALFVALIYDQRDIPEEAVHVAEYGLLGLLVYRALSHRIRDYSIYPQAALLVGMVGIVDEYIQWVVPSRYYELGDILLNFNAGALAQLALVTGLRPRLISTWPGFRSWGRLCVIAAAALLVISLSFLNTPQRIAWYVSEIPGLQFLLDSKSMMTQYGYRFVDDHNGTFRSRFSAEQLQRLDRERGAEVAATLDRYTHGEGYPDFQTRYSVLRDAYTHEIGVHMYRRNYHLLRAREGNRKQTDHYTIAYFENRILQSYFTNALNRSSLRWSQEVESEVSTGADKKRDYDSPVSKAVITQVSETQVMIAFLGGISLLLLAAVILFRLQSGRRA